MWPSELLTAETAHRCNCRASDRSLCGWPVFDPYTKFVHNWGTFILWWDLTYTAFLIPISVAFVINGRNDFLGWLNLLTGMN